MCSSEFTPLNKDQIDRPKIAALVTRIKRTITLEQLHTRMLVETIELENKLLEMIDLTELAKE